MDNLSTDIVKGLLNSSDNAIWNSTKRHIENTGKSLGWSKEQISGSIGENYNALIKIKYQATDAIKAQLTPEQLQNPEQDTVKAYLTGKQTPPNIDLASFDTTDTSNNQGMKNMRQYLVPLNLQESKFSKVSSLVIQNFKEVAKNPLSAFYFAKERQARNIAVMSGKSTLAEANNNLQNAKDQNPVKIAANILSGNTERQDRAANGIKGFLNNFLSGEGVAAKLLPAVAGFAGGKIGGFGNVTSVVIALISALIVPMIIRAFNGKSETVTIAEGLNNNRENVKEQSAQEQKSGRAREQTIRQNPELNQNKEIERPSNHNTMAKPMNEKAMMAHIQEKGICSLRATMGEKNPAFLNFVEKHNLGQALKQEELNLFNGKTEAVVLTSQALGKAKVEHTSACNITDNIKTGVSLG